ncbi:MAG: hypothetical protein AAF570_04430, partial [Bacteroidota bacterium]
MRQVDVSSGTLVGMQSTDTYLGTDSISGVGNMAPGPDCKIYVSGFAHISTIGAPDLQGASANFTVGVHMLLPG